MQYKCERCGKSSYCVSSLSEFLQNRENVQSSICGGGVGGIMFLAALTGVTIATGPIGAIAVGLFSGGLSGLATKGVMSNKNLDEHREMENMIMIKCRSCGGEDIRSKSWLESQSKD